MKKTILLLLAGSLASCGLFAQKFYFSAENPANCAASDGIITAVPTQGFPPFTYLWNNGATSVSIKNCTKGAYTVTITDGTGATVSHTHYLNSKSLDVYLSDSKPAAYCNPTSGSLTVTPVGGIAPFTYQWNNGQTGATAVGLALGTYTVTVLDAAGCSAAGEFKVGQVPNNYYPAASISTMQEPNCTQPSVGSLFAEMTGSGFGPYTYAWSNGDINQTASALVAGNYTVTITDGLGCFSLTSITLNKALNPAGSVICNGTNTGTVSVQLVNATAPVVYNWSNGQSGSTLSNLTNGNYAVTATDANGCISSAIVPVQIPYLYFYDASPKCFAGNNAISECFVYNDSPTSYLWDNGSTSFYNPTLSSGTHSITVTTSLGCSVVGSVVIAPPLAPPFSFAFASTQANCSTGTGGALNVTISGGISPYNIYASGPDGFVTSDLASLQNVQAGEYSITAYTAGCVATAKTTILDVGGFNPSFVFTPIDCASGYGSAAVVNVTSPGVQYSWSTGATTPDLYNLTPGCYSVTVTGSGSCLKHFAVCTNNQDTVQFNAQCGGLFNGSIRNDNGVPGCAGTVGIPFQLIRTQPSGALNMTDGNGHFELTLPPGTFDLETVGYGPGDIACPASGKFTVNSSIGFVATGLDFHFFNNVARDFRVRQRALRTAQPGYPYSLRFEVCNDASGLNNGSLQVDYGNFLANSLASNYFAQHVGAFSLTGETAGPTENSADFAFPVVTPGACELLQVDFTVPTTTSLSTEFITRGTATPTAGDPTPANNVSTLLNTVMGSFDPNSVMAYPARNGNPHDGGDIWRNTDQTITYQIFFQNTGTAPANLVLVRDTLDPNLNLETIRNVKASHDMKVSIEGNNNALLFKFPDIHLPDAQSDYANSIGSIQFDIDLKPNLPVGTEIRKHANIYFDYNKAIRTNTNVLKIVESTSIPPVIPEETSITVFPNPTQNFFGFYTSRPGQLRMFNSLGALVLDQKMDSGIQQVSTANLSGGIYLIQYDAGGTIQYGKLMVSH
jgi:uncharacterized repeat protein (TIGR01451 family)